MTLGRYSLLGLTEIDFGNPPLWHRDAASGQVAPRTHWSRIDYLDSAIVGDHKVLWEINRHQYLLAPAMCWLVDGEAARLSLVQSHIDDWLTENPMQVGVNWASSLEIAYRSISWIWLIWLLRDAHWETSLLARMAHALRASGRHIERNLSTYFSPNTHLTGEALGLLYLSFALPEVRESTRWWSLGSRILETWLDRQVRPDGVYFEQATQYQRYTLEIYLHYYLLASAKGHTVPESVSASLHRQFEVLRSLADASGRIPLIGDDDGGFLLPLDGGSPDNVAPLLEVGATLLDRPDLRVAGRNQLASATWLLGTAAIDPEKRRGSQPSWTDRYFAHGGLVTLRSGWGENDSVAVLDAGPHGVLNCGHAHSDALTFTLSLGSQPLFIDRGTLSYIGPERNSFRETASHNTLEFDHESSVRPLGPFQWGPIPRDPSARLRQSGRVTILECVAEGHAGTSRPSLHRRTVFREANGAWMIVDAGERRNCKHGVIRWQLAPGLAVIEASTGTLAVTRHDGAVVAWLVTCGEHSRNLVSRSVSLRLRHQAVAECLELETGPALDAATLILPAQSGIRAPKVTSHVLGRSIEWEDSARRHEVFWPANSRDTFDYCGWTVRARLAWWMWVRTKERKDSVEANWLVVADAIRIVSPSRMTSVEVKDDARGVTAAIGIDMLDTVPAEYRSNARPKE